MKKITNFLISSTFGILLISIIICFIYLISVSPYDELWNFQNVYKMYNGLNIYSDANVIITPLFYFISLAFLKIFGATLISFRFFNITLYSILFLLIYYTFKSLKVSKPINILFLTLIFTQSFQVINCGANYSTLSLIFILLGVLSYIKLQEKKYFHYLQGFLIFLVFFSKQNLGIYYALSILFFEFIYKTSLKKYIANQFKKFLTFIIPLLICLYIFFINGILYDFINYTFGGIFNFGNSNFVISFSPYLACICIFTLALYFYIIFNKKIFNEKLLPEENRKNLNLLVCITIGTTFSVFPILNSAHFIFIIPLYFIILFYFFDFIMLEDFFPSEKSFYLYIISIIVLSFVLIRLLTFHFMTEKDYIQIKDDLSPFNNSFVSPENFEKIYTMEEYIKAKNSIGKQVIIIAYDSAYTMINLNQNNGFFDLVFNGNLGYDGENKMIEKIKSMKSTEFLILTDEDECFWQESKKIRDFIINNLNKTGEILNYSIYEIEN